MEVNPDSCPAITGSEKAGVFPPRLPGDLINSGKVTREGGQDLAKPAAAKSAQAAAVVSAADQARRRAVLQDAALWKRFDDYFSTNWQAKETRKEIETAGCNWGLLKGWAVWSFHPAAKDEARQKRERGKQFRQRTQTAIVGYEAGAEARRVYSECQPRHAEVVEVNKKLADEARSKLGKAKDLFNADRMGRTWNTQYLVLSKEYITNETHWADKKVLTAIAHLVAAGQYGVDEKCIRESRLRDLIRKAIQKFEHDPRNSTIIALLQNAATRYHDFPKR